MLREPITTMLLVGKDRSDEWQPRMKKTASDHPASPVNQRMCSPICREGPADQCIQLLELETRLLLVASRFEDDQAQSHQITEDGIKEYERGPFWEPG